MLSKKQLLIARAAKLLKIHSHYISANQSSKFDHRGWIEWERYMSWLRKAGVWEAMQKLIRLFVNCKKVDTVQSKVAS